MIQYFVEFHIETSSPHLNAKQVLLINCIITLRYTYILGTSL